ncbi:MAG TPA: hypothetical protein VD993_06555 [Chitinophagaceae bacterium]|nr:hypothetical protein [Chitinophagaceae bacterium]
MHKRKLIPILLLTIIAFGACRKDKGNDGANSNYNLSYGSPIIYPKNGDHIITPVNAPAVKGEFSAFPEGLELDKETGEIDVEDSETGLRYRVTFTPDDGSAATSTTILLAGINYRDAFHVLASNDSIVRLWYNGDVNNAVPVSPGKTVFDIDRKCSKEGIAINRNTGEINLAQTIRNGFFGKHPDNDTREEFELEYMIDDGSKQVKQEIKIKLYYHNTLDDVPDDLLQLVKDRDGTVLNEDGAGIPYDPLTSAAIAGMRATGKPRPRPPCIFIIGR